MRKQACHLSQVRRDLHSNEQTQSDYNLLVFMHTHTHKHHII